MDEQKADPSAAFGMTGGAQSKSRKYSSTSSLSHHSGLRPVFVAEPEDEFYCSPV
jgi:hypothetical protein